MTAQRMTHRDHVARRRRPMSANTPLPERQQPRHARVLEAERARARASLRLEQPPRIVARGGERGGVPVDRRREARRSSSRRPARRAAASSSATTSMSSKKPRAFIRTSADISASPRSMPSACRPRATTLVPARCMPATTTTRRARRRTSPSAARIVRRDRRGAHCRSRHSPTCLRDASGCTRNATASTSRCRYVSTPSTSPMSRH